MVAYSSDPNAKETKAGGLPRVQGQHELECETVSNTK